MNQDLLDMTDKHHLLLVDLYQLTQNIFSLIEGNNIDEIIAQSENRGRLQNIIEGYQEKIISIIETLPMDQHAQDTFQRLKTWQLKIGNIIEQTRLLDHEIEKALLNCQEGVLNEIAQNFRHQESLQGYHQGSTKK